MFWLITIFLKITYQQTLFYSAFTDTTLTNIDNWSFIAADALNVIQQCGPYSIIGGFNKFALGQAATKFLLLPPHYQMTISLTLFIIDTWDVNEYFQIYVDENLEYNQAYSYSQGQIYICGQTGNDRKDSIFDIQFSFPHTGTTSFIELTSTLDQIPFDESWGFRNFRLFLFLCPSGCLICSESNSKAECQTWIIIGSFYTAIEYNSFSTDGWTILNGDLNKQQCSQIPSICGYGACGKDTKLIYTSISLPFHSQMKIKFKYLKIDSWESRDYALLQVNQNIKWKRSLSGLNQYLYGVCGTSSNDIFINVELTFPHYLTSTTIIISNTLDQSSNDESFGVRDIEIFVQNSMCGDTIVQEYEECDDGNLYPFDGCFNCVYSCVEGCSLCNKGICLGCYSGWIYQKFASTCQRVSLNIQSQNIPIAQNEPICFDYIEGCQECFQGSCIKCQNGFILKLESNSCIPNCGDFLKTLTEDCDGYNCVQRRFECPGFCNECHFGICQVCQQDYILQNNQCIQEQRVSICQPQCEICIQSVCYKCQQGQDLVVGQCQEICGNNSEAIYSLEECECNPYCIDCKFGNCYQCRETYDLIRNTCVSKCGDLIVQDDEECDDGNEIEFDGCYNCQFSCSQNCQSCQQGVCLDSCQLGYYLFNNICSSICGDLIIVGEEQCEDNNNENNDGCYQCKFTCPLNCNDCLNGECLICNTGFLLFDNTCTNICGDGVLSNLEECDDGNQNDGDGCSKNCLIEINWICHLDSECTYVQYPIIISEYLMQKNENQYVKITFSQPVLQQSNLNYLQTIKPSIIDLNETLFNITILEVQPALFQQTSNVEYVFQIELLQNLDYNPILEIKLTEQLYNNDQAPLRYMIHYIQIKQPNFITQQQAIIANAFQQINEVSVKSLCLLTILLMLLGNALSFWGIIDALQEQSYLKYINVLYPQTLIIYFQSSQILSVQPALDTMTLYQNEGKLLKFPYLQSYQKFEFYQVNADIAEGLRAEILIFATLFAVYVSTFVGVRVLSKLELQQFLQKWPKIIRFIQKIKRQVNMKQKEAKNSSLINTLRACTWDLIFMALLELKASHDFKSPRSFVCILIAISILITTIILLLRQVSGLQSWKRLNFNQFWHQKRDIFQVTKKFLILYILVFYQNEQELQTLILTLINAFYLIYIIQFKQLDLDNLEYVKSVTMESSLTIFTASTFVNWNIISNYLLYSQKIYISWIQMSILVSVLIIFIVIELYNIYKIVKEKIFQKKRNKILKEIVDPKKTQIQVTIVDQNQGVKNFQIKHNLNRTIFSRSKYQSKVYPKKF
ncbi:unnamed protein product [Paramecium sonneborni]|uniref:Insulin-like growth factor binding protein, N-terminal n=1 Tax=Paramecium sonneborni TaxID=65129 RepID=A0A8S1PTA0_9CILI|nr:unnamed protein product [Paramecium sonneborni]